ncbi:MAG: hypothetical protein OXI52_10340 [Caldilineaceae bacterium]|nr:hypothetical protein [Caldilineaceae bacterium]
MVKAIFNIMAKAIFIVGSTICLRIAVVTLQNHYRTTIGFLDIGFLSLIVLPMLYLTTLATILFASQDKKFRIAYLCLPALIVNAARRSFEYLQSFDSCQATSGGALEGFCNVVGMQVFINIPFMFLGTWALFYCFWKHTEY